MIPQLSIILVNYNEREHLRTVLEKLRSEFSAGTAEVIIVDNNSRDGSADTVRAEFPENILLEPHANLMYGAGNNLGLTRATADWVMILNPDVIWEAGALQKLFSWAKTKPGVDVAAPRLVYQDGRVQSSAHRRFPIPLTVFIDYCLPLQQFCMATGLHPYQLSAAEHRRTQRIAHATGACLLVRHEVIREIGTFDPQFSMYLEETDWQARIASAGFQSWLNADAVITHFGSAQKSFAQGSPHYLWGLRHYAMKHWSPRDRAALGFLVWTASIISLIFLCIAFLPSFLLKKNGGRLRHYLRVYTRLVWQLLIWPKKRPA